MTHRLLTVLCVLALAVALAACERRVTHDAPTAPTYDGPPVSAGNASYTVTDALPLSGGRGYEDSPKAARVLFQNTPNPPSPATKAYGKFDVTAGEGFRGTAAAAFFFPTGSLTGGSPNQEGGLDIIRWEGAETNFGGVRIGTDHRARLIRGKTVGSVETTQAIGDPFSLQEGCWNWVVISQKLNDEVGTDPSRAQNEVFLNGRRIVESHAANKYSATGGATSVGFGMPYIDAGSGSSQQNDRSLEFYVDDPYIADDASTLPSPGTHSTACKPPRPNILFIVTDDHHASDTMHQMPSVTKWFRNGAVEAGGQFVTGGTEFTDGYATTPVCCPARSSILSGKFAHNHGVRTNSEGDALAASAQLQHKLESQTSDDEDNYQTGIVGKYLNDWNPYLDPPAFDKWWIFSGGYKWYFNDNGTVVNRTTTYSTTYIRDKAKEFIDHTEGQDSDPWFLYVAPYAPHEQGAYPYADMAVSPYSGSPVPPPPSPDVYVSRKEGAPGNPDTLADKPEWVRRFGDARTVFFNNPPSTTGGSLRDQMLRSLQAGDDLVEQLFDKLVEKGEERDTLAFFVADNGYMWREHGNAANETAAGVCTASQLHCGLIGKSKPYTESIQIPYYMRWPANPNVPRAVSDQSRFVANIDMAPTALDAAGLSGGDDMDGRSLLKTADLRNEVLTEIWGSTSPLSVGTWASLRGRRDSGPSDTRSYQYIEYFENDGVSPRPPDAGGAAQEGGSQLREYYDLNADPYQLTNLLRDGNPITPSDMTFVAELRDRLRRARLCEGPSCRMAEPTAGPDSPPRIQIETPQSGAVVDKKVFVAVDASDNLGVKSVDFYLDDQFQRSVDATPHQSYIDVSGVSTGQHVIKAVARDANASSSAEVNVTVERYDVETTNVSGGTRGGIEVGDTVKYGFDHVIDPGTLLPGWNGTETQGLTVEIQPDDPAFNFNDTLTVLGVPLGTLDLGRQGYWGWRLPPSPVSAQFTNSKMIMEDGGKAVRVTLGGTRPPLGAETASGTMVLNASNTVCPIGPPCRITESVNPDPDNRPDLEF